MREEAFVCMFYGCADHLDKFCFWRKRIEKRRFEYDKNSYCDEFVDFPPRSYSCVPPRSDSRASSRTSSCALPQFPHGPNHRSYNFGSRENRFVSRHIRYGSRPHHGDHFSRRPGSSAGASHTHFEPKHLDGLCFSHCGSCPTGSSGEVLKTVKTSSGCMVKCWIPKIYLTNLSTEPSTFSCPM
jgi:hypothetical protein